MNNDPLRQTVRTDVAHVALLIGGMAGFFGGGGLWLWALYDPAVTEQSMVWFLGALPAAIVGAFVGKWAVLALLTR